MLALIYGKKEEVDVKSANTSPNSVMEDEVDEEKTTNISEQVVSPSPSPHRTGRILNFSDASAELEESEGHKASLSSNATEATGAPSLFDRGRNVLGNIKGMFSSGSSSKASTDQEASDNDGSPEQSKEPDGDTKVDNIDDMEATTEDQNADEKHNNSDEKENSDDDDDVEDEASSTTKASAEIDHDGDIPKQIPSSNNADVEQEAMEVEAQDEEDDKEEEEEEEEDDDDDEKDDKDDDDEEEEQEETEEEDSDDAEAGDKKTTKLEDLFGAGYRLKSASKKEDEDDLDDDVDDGNNDDEESISKIENVEDFDDSDEDNNDDISSEVDDNRKRKASSLHKDDDVDDDEKDDDKDDKKDDDKDEEEEEADDAPKKKSKVSVQPKKKVAWSKQETKALQAGHAKYGMTGTPWARIKKDKVFGKHLKNRTGTNCKDKWRNLERAAKEKQKWAA